MPITSVGRPRHGSRVTPSPVESRPPSTADRAREGIMTGLAFVLVLMVAIVDGVGLQPWRTPTSNAATGETDGSLAAACPSPRPPVQVAVSRVSPASLGVQVTAGWGGLQSLRFGPA